MRHITTTVHESVAVAVPAPFQHPAIPATFFEFMYFLDKAVGFLPQHARFDTLSDAHKAGFQGF